MKRILSLLLCAVLLCSVLPTHVSAEGPDPLTVQVIFRDARYVYSSFFTGETLAGNLVDQENCKFIVAWDPQTATISVEKNPNCRYERVWLSSIAVSGGERYDTIRLRLGEDTYLGEFRVEGTETSLCPSLEVCGSGRLGGAAMSTGGRPDLYRGTDRGNIILSDSVQVSEKLNLSDSDNKYLRLIDCPNRIVLRDDASVEYEVCLNYSGALSYTFSALSAVYGVEIDTRGSVYIDMEDGYLSNWNGLTAERRVSTGIYSSVGSIEIRNVKELQIIYPTLHVSKHYDSQTLGGSAMGDVGTEISYDPDALYWDDSEPEKLYAYTRKKICFAETPGVYFLPCEGSVSEDGVYSVKADEKFCFLAVFRRGYMGGEDFRLLLNGAEEIEPICNGSYRIASAVGLCRVTAEGVVLNNKPFARSPSDCVLYSTGDTVSLPLSFTLQNPDYLEHGPASVKLECPGDGSFLPREIDCSGMDGQGQVNAAVRIPWSPGMEKAMRLSLTWGGKTYYSQGFTVRGTSDPEEASNLWPAAVSVCTSDGVWHRLAMGESGGAYARYGEDGVLHILADISAVRVEDEYYGALTLQCAPGARIVNNKSVSGIGTAVDISGDVIVIAGGCGVSSFTEDAGDAAVGIRSRSGSVAVSGAGALTVTVISDGSAAGKAVGIEAEHGSISIDVLNAAEANICIELNAAEMEPFAAEGGAELLDCNALIVTYDRPGSSLAQVDVSNTGQYSYNLCEDAAHARTEIYAVGCSRTLTLQENEGGETQSHIVLKYGGRTYRCGQTAQVAYNALVYVEAADPDAYHETERVTGVYCTDPRKTGNDPAGYTEYSTRVTGDGVVEIVRRQTLLTAFRCQGSGSESRTLRWTLSDPSANPAQCTLELTYADGSRTAHSLSLSQFRSGEYVLTGRPVSARLTAVFPGSVRVTGPEIPIDFSFYVDYTDAGELFNANACLPAGDVGTVGVMDFSRFVHGGSGTYRYWLSMSDAENCGYTYTMNEGEGLLRLTRDYPRAASEKNGLGFYNCYVDIYDAVTGCSARLNFTVGAFSENPETVGYPVYVNGLQVLSVNAADVLDDGTVRYTPAAGGARAVLTLTDAHLTTAWNGSVTGDDGGFFGCIVTFEPLDIVVAGSCSISLSGEDYVSGRGAYPPEYVEGEQYAAIVAGLSGNTFTLTGDGALSITGSRAISSFETCFIDGPEVFCTTDYGIPDGTNLCFVSGSVFSVTCHDCIYSCDPLNWCALSGPAGSCEIWLMDENADGAVLSYSPVTEEYYRTGFRDEHTEYIYPRAVFITDRGVSGAADGGTVTALVCGSRSGTARVAAAQYVGGQMRDFRMAGETVDLAVGGTAVFRFAPAEGAEYRLFLLEDGAFTPISPAWSSRP
jgi:hypothetical protein